MNYMFYIGLPCLFIAMLFALGFKMRKKWVAIVAIIGLSGICAWIWSQILEGLARKEIMTASRHADGVFRLADNARDYWFSVVFWSVLSFVIFGILIWSLIKTLNTDSYAFAAIKKEDEDEKYFKKIGFPAKKYEFLAALTAMGIITVCTIYLKPLWLSDGARQLITLVLACLGFVIVMIVSMHFAGNRSKKRQRNSIIGFQRLKPEEQIVELGKELDEYERNNLLPPEDIERIRQQLSLDRLYDQLRKDVDDFERRGGLPKEEISRLRKQIEVDAANDRNKPQ